MSRELLYSAGVFFCPISSLPDLIEKGKISCLEDSLFFDSEIQPGWIRFNSDKVTILSSNEMFEPILQVPHLFHPEEHTFKINSDVDLGNLIALFKKPLIMCVTRRQEDEAMINGFDTDFVIVFDPSDSKVAQELSRVTEYVEKHLRKRKKFHLTIDLSEKLDEISPLDFKKHVMWLNCFFHVTNYHAPNPVLTLDIFYLWFILLPCCIAVALPYRLYRKLRCVDRKIDLNIQFFLEATDSVPLALYFFSGCPPNPGRYRTESHKYHLRACPGTELRSLLYLMNC